MGVQPGRSSLSRLLPTFAAAAEASGARRQLPAFLWAAGALTLSIPLALAVGQVSHSSADGPLRVLALVWAVIGLPCIAAFLGASAGAGLAVGPAPVPAVSAWRRSLAGLLMCVLYAALFAAAAACFVSAMGGDRILWADRSGTRIILWRALIASLAIGLPCVILISFTASRALGRRLPGSLIGLLAGGGSSAALGFVLGLQAYYSRPPMLHPSVATMLAAACALGALAGLYATCARLDHMGQGRKPSAALGWTALLGGAALCVIVSTAAFHGLVLAPEPAPRERETKEQRLINLWKSPELLKAESQGFLATNLIGQLIIFKPDGDREVLLPGDWGRLWADFPWLSPVAAAAWHIDGSLWVMLRTGRSFGRVFMHGRPGAPFESYAIHEDYPEDFHRVKDRLMLSVGDYHFDRLIPLPVDSTSRETIYWDWKTPRWELPQFPRFFLPHGIISDGTLWGSGDGEHSFLLLAQGSTETLRVDVAKGYESFRRVSGQARGVPQLLRATDDKLWVLFNDEWLFLLDRRTGDPLWHRRIPTPRREGWAVIQTFEHAWPIIQTFEQGFIRHFGERVVFVDWEGRMERLD